TATRTSAAPMNARFSRCAPTATPAPTPSRAADPVPGVRTNRAARSHAHPSEARATPYTPPLPPARHGAAAAPKTAAAVAAARRDPPRRTAVRYVAPTANAVPATLNPASTGMARPPYPRPRAARNTANGRRL